MPQGEEISPIKGMLDEKLKSRASLIVTKNSLKKETYSLWMLSFNVINFQVKDICCPTLSDAQLKGN